MGTLWFTVKGSDKEASDTGHIEVALRMIGHQLLLDSKDSSTRVLPIKKEGDSYKIEFESDFQFTSGDLVATIERTMRKAKIAKSYRVQVKDCDSNLIIYSYEIGPTASSDIIPCGMRPQPKGCYSLLITLLDSYPYQEVSPSTDQTDIKKKQTDFPSNTSVIITFLLIAIFLLFLFNKKRKVKLDPNLILIGAYRFDKRNMKLTLEKIEVELSSKEADLLSLLHSSANTTLEREHILKVVWGDEGDYIGRTLDVFISKLRKKLEADPNVKIVNVRGIGYKLILNNL